MRRALITGISGQDGFFLTRQLLSKGYDLVGTVRNINSDKNKSFAELFPDVKILETSDATSGTFDQLFSGFIPNEIYNLAATSSVGESFQFLPERTTDSELIFENLLISICKNLNLETTTVVHASSAEIFGDSANTPQSEETTFKPISPYGNSKMRSHLKAIDFRNQHGLKVSMAILFNHESEFRTEKFLLTKICVNFARIKLGLEKRFSLGNMFASRDWGFSGDYVDAMHRMAMAETPSDFVISTGKSISVFEVASKVLQFSELKGSVEDYISFDSSLSRPSDPRIQCGDSSKINSELGWSHTLDVNNLIERIYTYHLMKLRS
jgi:GDPmannose 4,6-dehydratase